MGYRLFDFDFQQLTVKLPAKRHEKETKNKETAINVYKEIDI
jgi:hypothetical protein